MTTVPPPAATAATKAAPTALPYPLSGASTANRVTPRASAAAARERARDSAECTTWNTKRPLVRSSGRVASDRSTTPSPSARALAASTEAPSIGPTIAITFAAARSATACAALAASTAARTSTATTPLPPATPPAVASPATAASATRFCLPPSGITAPTSPDCPGPLDTTGAVAALTVAGSPTATRAGAAASRICFASSA